MPHDLRAMPDSTADAANRNRLDEWGAWSFAPWLSAGRGARPTDPADLRQLERALAERVAGAGLGGLPPAESLSREALTDEATVLLRHAGLRQLTDVTARRFPHVVNRLAAAWFSPPDLFAALDAMLFSDRTERQGFPPEIVSELGQVRAHYEAYVAPVLKKAHARQQSERAQQEQLDHEQRKQREERIRLRRLQGQQAGGKLGALVRRLLAKD